MASRLRCHPPELTKDDERYPGHDPRYAKLTDAELPTTESPALTIDRVVPYWNETILPRLKSGERVIIAAHGNLARAGEIPRQHGRRRDPRTEHPDRRTAGV